MILDHMIEFVLIEKSNKVLEAKGDINKDLEYISSSKN